MSDIFIDPSNSTFDGIWTKRMLEVYNIFTLQPLNDPLLKLCDDYHLYAGSEVAQHISLCS